MNRRIFTIFCCAALLIASSGRALHAACDFALQGEGRVMLDMRTFRLDDGREVRLAGIETTGETATRGREALASLIDGRDVTLHGSDDGPDRYGRQPAFVFLKGSETSIQSELLVRGEVLISPIVADKACSTALLATEATARVARRGIWASSAALKNAESTDDILAGVGRFAVVEGTVLSTRLAGAVFYVNFGRRWTQDFAVTISRRIIPSLEGAGIDLKSLKSKRIRVRGWIEKRGGPRIEVTHAGQIELIAAADGAAKDTMPRDEGK